MLRIIGGELKRRRLHTPKDARTTRPMPDRVRLALFNLLRGHTEGVEVFDAFAGSGALGFEALSRGATHAVFVERERRVASLIEQSASELGLTDRCEVVTGDALGAGALARCPEGVHLIFFDPPYALVRDPAQWPRVALAFSRLIGKLDETGYAVLRTPLPLYHVEGEGWAQGDEEDDEAPPAPPAERVDVDLRIPGALGPETHEYGGMALHLYMRDAGA
jgi:16S rRNA G966 N2-methylase RsmD